MSTDDDKPRGFKSLFSQIRRRRVLRSATIYLAASWAAIEVASIIVPALELPGWTMRAVIGLFAAGFVVIVVLSWMFDISLKGLSRTDDENGSAEPAPVLRNAIEIPDKSLAVLPMSNMSGDEDDNYFADGLSEELLNLLSRFPDLKVAARTSSFAFRERDIDTATIGSRLGVKHLLEGTVRRAGDRLRVGSQLIEADTGYQVWSERFDREMSDIFALQDDIASAIVEALLTRLEQAVPQTQTGTAAPPTRNIEAYQTYLRGLYLWRRRGETALKGAIAAYSEAITLDPEFARAHAALASAQAVLHEYTGHSREDDFALAEPRARKAIELDATLGEPFAVLGYMGLRLWRWSVAEKNLQKAIELDPDDPLFHQWYANLLNDLGRHEQALKEGLAAYELDPVSPTANNVLALTYLFMGRDEPALEHTAVAREFGVGGLVPDYVDVITRTRRADADGAARAWKSLLQKAKRPDTWVEPVMAAIANPDRRQDALRAIDTALGSNSLASGDCLLVYLALGETERLFALAQAKLADHSLTHVWLLMPEGEAFRRHARFLPLMRSLGLVGYWERNGWPEHVAPAASETG